MSFLSAPPPVLLSGKMDARRRAQVADAMKKWDNVKQKFIADHMTRMQTAAQKVQQDGAVDVTTDVLFAMQGK